MAEPENTDIDDTLAANLAKPKKVTGDTGSNEQQDLAAQVKMAEYLQRRRAANRGGLPFRLLKMRSGGAVQ